MATKKDKTEKKKGVKIEIKGECGYKWPATTNSPCVDKLGKEREEHLCKYVEGCSEFHRCRYCGAVLHVEQRFDRRTGKRIE